MTPHTAKVCTKCRVPYSEGARFCQQCGLRIVPLLDPKYFRYVRNVTIIAALVIGNVWGINWSAVLNTPPREWPSALADWCTKEWEAGQQRPKSVFELEEEGKMTHKEVEDHMRSMRKWICFLAFVGVIIVVTGWLGKARDMKDCDSGAKPPS